jgi:hypothetical protein
VQLSSPSATLKALQADRREKYFDQYVITSLVKYDKLIEDDIAFIKTFRLREIEINGGPQTAQEELRKQLNLLQDLQEHFFEKIVSPAAKCFQAAIDHGLDVEIARETLRPLSDLLTRLILVEGQREQAESQAGLVPSAARREMHDAKVQHLHNKVWQLVRVPDSVMDYLDVDQKSTENDDLKKKCDAVNQMPRPEPPHISDYDTLPQLDVARALFLLFVHNDKFAMQVLESAKKKELKDFKTPRLLADLMYIQGDNIDKFLETLDGVRLLAREQQELIKRVNNDCWGHCEAEVLKQTPKLMDRAKLQEHLAANLIAYSIAQDVAKGIESSERLLPLAEEYGQTLKEAVKNPTPEEIGEVANSYRDTAAIVTIVAEAKRATRSNLNKDNVSEAINVLDDLIAREDMRLSGLPFRQKNDYVDLTTLRVHRMSGRGLLE